MASDTVHSDIETLSPLTPEFASMSLEHNGSHLQLLSEDTKNLNGSQDDGILIDEDDEINLGILSSWMKEHADVLPSLTRKYCSILFLEGIGSVNRLAKALQDNTMILSRLNFKNIDGKEIISALKR